VTNETKECASCNKTPKWKQDFPIEWEGDHYVTRREMVKFMTLARCCWLGQLDRAIAGQLLHRGSKAERDIGAVSALERTGSLLFRYPPTRIPALPSARRMASWSHIRRSVLTSPVLLCTTRLTMHWFAPVITACSISTREARLPVPRRGRSRG